MWKRLNKKKERWNRFWIIRENKWMSMRWLKGKGKI